jgi:hypothetical protein
MLSDFQVQCIQDYFDHFNWELEELEKERNDSVLQRPRTSSNNQVPVQDAVASPSSQSDSVQLQDNPPAQDIDVNDDHIHVAQAGNNEDISFSDDEEGQCPHCFLEPCIATIHQGWLGNGQTARKENTGLRRVRYKKFWQVMHYKSAWKKKKYLRKKALMMHRAEVDQSVVDHQREVMPDCVLDLVRGLYPNMPNIPYAGHQFW